MSLLRIALHQCAELLADALEAEELATKAGPKKRRRPTHNPPPPREVSELAHQRARRALTRLGVPIKSVG